MPQNTSPSLTAPRLRGTITAIDAASQEAGHEIERLALAALAEVDPASMPALAATLDAIVFRAQSVANDINCMAEEVGCNARMALG